MTDRDAHDSLDGTLERAKDKALGPHDDHPGIADHVGEAAGGISGVLAGAAIGSIGGPLGTLIGGIAGAMGGWWTGRAIAEAATSISSDDDAHYRRHFSDSRHHLADRSYEDVQPAYHLGHIASQNPNFVARTFDEVEPELERGWTDDARRRHGEWGAVRGYVSEGFNRGRRSTDTAANSAAGSFDRVGGATTGSVDDDRAARASGLAPEGDPTEGGGGTLDRIDTSVRRDAGGEDRRY
jgi:hypothetical protein